MNNAFHFPRYYSLVILVDFLDADGQYVCLGMLSCHWEEFVCFECCFVGQTSVLGSWPCENKGHGPITVIYGFGFPVDQYPRADIYERQLGHISRCMAAHIGQHTFSQ